MTIPKRNLNFPNWRRMNSQNWKMTILKRRKNFQSWKTRMTQRRRRSSRYLTKKIPKS